MYRISGTACAVPCPSPIYTDEEFNPIVIGIYYASWLNVAVGFVLFLNVYILKPSKRNVFGETSTLFDLIT